MSEERKRMRQQAEKLWADAWTRLAEGLCVLDDQALFRLVNPAFCRLLGYAEHELLGQSLARISPEEAGVGPVQQLEKLGAAPNERDIARRAQLLRSDGRCVTVEARHVALEGAPAQHAFLVRPISAPATEQRLLRDVWPALWSSIEDGVHITDAAGTFLFVSPSYCQIVGYEEHELVGQPFVTTVPPELRQEYMARYHRATAERLSGVAAVFTLLRKDGTRIQVDARQSLIPTPSGDLFAFIVRDITRQTLLEQQLLHADRVRALGTLAGGVAHEFNNLLVSIVGYSEMIATRKEAECHECAAFASRIQRAALRGTKITSQLLPYARKQEPRRAPVAITELLNEVVELFNFSAADDVRVSCSCIDRDCWLLANAVQVHQAILNLLLNARDAVEEGGQIRISARKVARPREMPESPLGFVEIAVSDDGCGMSEEVQRRMFEPFFTTKEAGKGTGLGMTLVFSTVASHGGVVRVDSSEGQGTTVYLIFPCAEADEAERQ